MKILVTAGPTREALDPVRFLSNRSTGKMGYAIASAAVMRNHEVRLISGPVALDAPANAVVTHVISAAEMHTAVLNNIDWCDALIMSAAVADWRPRNPSSTKLKKSSMPSTLALERTPDILEAVAARKQHQIVVGFAAETQDLEVEARRKLQSKHLDLIVANDVSRKDAGFEVNTNAVSLISTDASVPLPLMTKHAVAVRVLECIEAYGAADRD